MGIDRETAPRFFYVAIDDNKKYLDALRKQAEEQGQNEGLEEGEPKSILLGDEGHSFEVEEYYFDEHDAELIVSGNMKSNEGKSFYSFAIPLSDIVMIDILNYSMKKLAKLKTAMESLK